MFVGAFKESVGRFLVWGQERRESLVLRRKGCKLIREKKLEEHISFQLPFYTGFVHPCCDHGCEMVH